MPKTKSAAKKQKAATPKKVSASSNKPSAKGIKLGGVPNQGSVAQKKKGDN